MESSSATRESEEASQINIPLRVLPEHKRIQMRVHDSEIEELARALHESEVLYNEQEGKQRQQQQAAAETATAEKDTAESKVVILVNL